MPLELDRVRELAGLVLDEVERAVVGKRDALELTLLGLLAEGHVLLEDYPGLAKTLAARSFAQTLSMLVLAAALSVIGAIGWIEEAAGKGAWLALVGGLIVAAPTAVTGFADWLTIEWGSATWRTATLHLSAMVTAVCLFGVATWLQWDGYQDGTVTTGGLVFALLGLGALTTGGWLGGAIVFVHGMRVVAERRTPEDERLRRERGAA